MREQTLISCFTSRLVFTELTFGRRPVLTKRSRASTFQELFARLSKNHNRITFASDTPVSSTHFYLVSWKAQKVWRNSVSVFLLSCRKVHCFPFEQFFWFPLTAVSLSCFKTTLTLRFVTFSWFNSTVAGVKVSQSKFLICTPLDHCFQRLIVANRYLLMNLQVVQFQYDFELHRLTYPSVVQTFQNTIKRYLWHRE